MESVSFDIDNTPPTIEVQPPARTGARTSIRFTVRDEQAPVQRVEYSLDASRWQVVYPKDGIPDSRREEFEIMLAGIGGWPERAHPGHRCDEQRGHGGVGVRK